MKRNLIFLITSFITICGYSQTIEILESSSDTIITKEGKLVVVELTKVQSKDHSGHNVRIIFTQNVNNGGTIIDNYNIDKEPVTGCDPIIYDYNGDGNLDYSIISDIAARGANEIRTIFIFNSTNQRFIQIKNSNQYPNLIYNQKLNYIDSWAFHGGTSQYFLTLQNDSLVPIYQIDVYGTERILSKYENESWFKIKTDTIEDVGFPRYINYAPFEEYKN